MTRYDIFRLDGGSPLWIGATETMRDAHARATQVGDCAECMIFDAHTGEKIVIARPENQKVKEAL